MHTQHFATRLSTSVKPMREVGENFHTQHFPCKFAVTCTMKGMCAADRLRTCSQRLIPARRQKATSRDESMSVAASCCLCSARLSSLCASPLLRGSSPLLSSTTILLATSLGLAASSIPEGEHPWPTLVGLSSWLSPSRVAVAAACCGSQCSAENSVCSNSHVHISCWATVPSSVAAGSAACCRQDQPHLHERL